MKVLMINGSPNKNGCTYTALNQVGQALENEGIEKEIVQVGTQAIKGCTGCEKCEETGLCVFDDEVNNLIKKISQANGLIVGSPVYYASANGGLLSLLDRIFFAAGRSFAYKPAAAVASARRAGTTDTIDGINKYFAAAQMPIVSSTYWNGVHGNTPAEVYKDLEGLQTMRNLGRNMAWLIKCIAAGKAAGVEYPKAETDQWTNFIR